MVSISAIEEWGTDKESGIVHVRNKEMEIEDEIDSTDGGSDVHGDEDGGCMEGLEVLDILAAMRQEDVRVQIAGQEMEGDEEDQGND